MTGENLQTYYVVLHSLILLYRKDKSIPPSFRACRAIREIRRRKIQHYHPYGLRLDFSASRVSRFGRMMGKKTKHAFIRFVEIISIERARFGRDSVYRKEMLLFPSFRACRGTKANRRRKLNINLRRVCYP